MAGGTRSGRSQKDEDTDNTRTADGKLKTKVMKSSSTGGGAAAAASESANLRRSTRGTPVKKMTISNPSSHKPERREHQTSPTSSDKRSERDEKKSSPSPLRRSGRIEKNGISSSPGSKKSSNSPGSQGTKKRKKEANDGSPGASGTDKQSKDNEAETHSDDLPKKRKRLDARSFTAFLMPEMKQTKSSGKKHQKEDTSRYDSVNSGAKDPNETQNDEDDCHWMKAQKLKLSDHCEDLVEGSNSVSRKLLTLGNDERSKKRKVCSAEAYESKDASNSSVSIYSDNSSQLSPVIATDHDTTVERVVDGEDDKIVSYSLGSEELREAEIVAPNGKEKTPAVYGPSSHENTTNLASEHEATLLDKDTREPSIAHITSSSPQETEQSTLCCKLQRVHNESQASETCSFNSEIKYHLPVSSPKEGHNPVASFEDNCKGVAVVSSLKDDIRAEARGKSAGAISQNCSITSPHTTAPRGEDRGRQMAQDGTGNSGEYLSSAEPFREIQNHTGQNACLLCKKPGLLLCCDGKDCKRSYHLSCLDPPLKDIPTGVWLCLFCVKKKMESGVYSVSEGMESVLDVKEGIQNGNHYLVKYKGLAHVHDRWVPESQIILEAPTLLSKFNRRHQKEKVTWWKQEWTEPHRLLSKRLLMPFKVADEYFSGHSNNNSDCYHEWLVKWKGLGYEHATWEFETAPFLCSSQGISLIKDYESRREEAKKASDPSRADKALQVKKNPFQKMPRLPDRFSSESDNDYLSSINRLREFWHKSQNAIFVDEQERIIKLVLFILTVQFDTCRPFLIISTVSSLSVWESEFARLAPAINLVIYSGNRDVRKMIRNVEFFVEGSCIMFQVLLSHTDAIAEDFEVLDSIGWEAVIVDECQNSRVSKHLEKLKHLSTDFRLLLLSGQLKDSIAEYLNLLSFLDSRDKENSIANHIYSKDTVGALSILKEKLAHYLAYERKEDSSKFVEYWVPVRLSNVQLEQYCAALLSNSSALRSNSKIDHVGALRDILMSARKCCDHPYIVDPSLQSTLTKDLPPGDYLDIGVNASGKLLLLDKILQEIKNQGIRVLILFQSIGGAGRNSIGDILDDFLRQRFGADSYERVDSGLITSKKLAALNMFNDKARGRFVFLIENRACLPSIKLSSVDAAIIFDSDWNLLNDLRALQRISIESQFEQVKVFRLYSSCTVEEKVLIFAKQDMILESKQNINPSVSHSLLGWGAGYLFKKLDEFHQNIKVNNFSGTSSDKTFLNDVVLEVLSKLPNKTEGSDTGHSSILIKAQHSGVSYSRNIILVGEKENISLPDKDPPSFWSKLLEGRNPQWRYISQSSQRIRRKVQSLDEPAKLLEVENDEGNLKRKKVGSAITNPTYLQSKRKEALICKDAMVPDNFPPSCGSGQLSPTSTKKMLIIPNSVSYDSEESPNYANVGSESMPRSPYDVNHVIYNQHLSPVYDSNHSISELHIPMVESERRGKLCNTQRSLHLLLKPELSKLCETLRLPEDSKSLAETLLEYVLNNHHVSREPETILQAFLLSLCWRAASLLKHTMDRKESLVLAKQYLKYECDEEQAYSVYVKLRILKKRFSRKRGPVQDDSELSYPENQSFASTKDIPAEPLSCHTSNVRSYTPVLEGDRARERDDGPRCIDDLVEEEHVNVSVPLSKIHEKIRPVKEELQKKRIILIEKVCLKREEELNLKQQAELSDFNIQREAEKMKLKNNYDSQLGVTRTIILDPAVRNCKIRLLNQDFSKKMAAFDQHMKFQRRKLALKQADARNKERQIKGRWMEEAKTGKLAELFDDIPLSDSGFMLEGFMVSEKACEENVMISSVPSLDHPCQDVNPIGRTDSSESVMEFLEIPASIPNEVVNKLPVVTEPLDSQCDNMNTRETIKPIGTSTEIPATVFPGVTCGMTVGTESPETHLAGVTANMLNRMDEIVVIETEAPASQCNNINEIESTEPTETPLENPVAVLPGMAGDLAMETVSSYSPSDTMSAEENREMHSSSIMAKVAAIEQNGFMDASGPCVTISLQTGSEFRSAGNNASAGCTSDNSESTNQHQVLSGNEIERPDVSDSIASDQAPPPVLVSVLNSVDSIPAQGEPDKLNQSGTDSLQQMTLPTDILLVEHSQGIAPGAPIASEEPSNQEDIPNHQPEVNMQQSIVDAPVHVGRSDQMASRCDVNPLSLSITAAGGTFSEDICSGYQIDRSTNQSQELMQKQVLGTAPLVEQGNQVVSDDVYSLHPPTTTPGRTCTGDLNTPYIQTTGQTVLAQLPTLSSDLQVEQSDQSISHDVDASSIQGTCSGILSSTCHQTQCSASTSQTESLMQQPTVAAAVQVDQSYQISQSVVHPLPPSVPVPPERAQSGDLNSTIVQSDFGNRVLHNFATNWMPPQGLHPDPLQNELAKIRRQIDLCIKMQEDKKLRLKLECDLEIEKVRRKYDALLQDAETEFLRDKRVIDTIYKKVMMNQVLAEQFRARFIENKGGASSSLQGSRSSYVPQFLHASQPQLAQRPASAVPSISFPIPATLPPVVVSVPAPPPSSLASTRIWPPASVVSSISAAQMGCHTSPVAFSSNPVRPHFSPTFPARATLQLGSEPRAPAPHLHRFRPHASVSPQNRLLQMGGTTTLQQHLANAATASSGRPSLIVPYPPRSPSMAPGGQETLPRGHSLPVDLPLDVGDSHVGGDTTNMATEATAAFETWFMSNLSPASIEVPSNTSAMRPVATSDVVCISDDDN